MDHNQRSEFEGGGLLPNTVFPMGDEALTASDKLRLQSITGQEKTAFADPDPFFWYGNVQPDPVSDNESRARAERLADRDRYKY